MAMKRLMPVWVMILCLVPMALNEPAAVSSFDFGFSMSHDGFTSGTVLPAGLHRYRRKYRHCPAEIKPFN